MTSAELENLARLGHLKREPPVASEIKGLLHSGEARLADAANRGLSLESRFDLAYNAAHALALAGLRLRGYRSENRFLVFQVLPHTLGLPPSTWRVLSKGHEARNVAEYEGAIDLDELKVISVSVERGLLARSDALAKNLGISRAALIERGLEVVLADARS